MAKQATELDRINRPKDYDRDDGSDVDYNHDEDVEVKLSATSARIGPQIRGMHARQEEEEIKELERKKRGLEDRVSGMERDLGGLLR